MIIALEVKEKSEQVEKERKRPHTCVDFVNFVKLPEHLLFSFFLLWYDIKEVL